MNLHALHGGKAEKAGKTEKDFPPKKLNQGERVEHEHTNRDDVARRIAMDHLTEDQEYYRKLKAIEKSASISGFLDEMQKIALSSPEAIKALASTELGRSIITGAFVGGVTSAHAGLMDQTPVYDQWSGNMRNPNAIDSIGRAAKRGAKGVVVGGIAGGAGSALLKALT